MVRIDRLLSDSDFDERWKHRLDEEIRALAALDHTGKVRETVRMRVPKALKSRIESASDFNSALTLLQYADAIAGGRFAAGYTVLERREAERLRTLIRGDQFDPG